MTEREAVTLARHPDRDLAKTRPRVEPAVEELQLGLAGFELGEGESGLKPPR